MDIEIAKEKLKVIDIKFFLNGMTEQSNYIVDKADEINIAIETVLNELEKKEAIINEMARYIDKITEEIAREKGVEDFELCNNKCTDNGEYIDCKDCIKKYFTKKATDNVGE